jgi:hypothetical protein
MFRLSHVKFGQVKAKNEPIKKSDDGNKPSGTKLAWFIANTT